MAQVAEHILGKDEVTSSNLVISSINPRKQAFAGIFAVRIFEGNGGKWTKMRCVTYKLLTIQSGCLFNRRYPLKSRLVFFGTSRLFRPKSGERSIIPPGLRLPVRPARIPRSQGG